MNRELSITSFSNAISSLAEVLEAHETAESSLKEFVRDGAIQRFEYTYELSHKMLKRYLQMTDPSFDTIDAMSFPALIRTGFERGLLKSSWKTWKIFREARNITSHTYNKNKAEDVFAVIPNFYLEVKFLEQQLRKRA